MTENRSNGGPAFPQHDLSGYGIGPKMDGDRYMVDGMSLRDWIAGQVVASAMTNANGLGSMSAEERREIFRGVAIISYEVADAMLTARSPSSKEA